MVQKTAFQRAGIAILLFMSVIALELLKPSAFFSKDIIDIWFFDIGQGDAMFINARDTQILIDGGPSEEIVRKLDAVLPLWDRRIDAALNTHPHADHVTGINFLSEYYFIDSYYSSGQAYGTHVYKWFLEKDPKTLRAGDDFFGMQVLWPKDHVEGRELDDPNSGSVVLLFEAFGIEVLFAGDIGTEEELELLPDLPDIDILKVGHQGSRTSSHPEFLQAISPEVSIIPVGENSYGHPHADVVKRLQAISQNVLRTDIDGDIRVRIYPDRYEISTHSLGL
jgi:competence protein ComEC